MPQIVTQEMQNWVGINNLEDARNLKPNELIYAQDVEFNDAGDIVPLGPVGLLKADFASGSYYGLAKRYPQLVIQDGPKLLLFLSGGYKYTVADVFSDYPASNVGLGAFAASVSHKGTTYIVGGDQNFGWKVKDGRWTQIGINYYSTDYTTPGIESLPWIEYAGGPYGGDPHLEPQRSLVPSIFVWWRGRVWAAVSHERLRFSHPGTPTAWRANDWMSYPSTQTIYGLHPTPDRLLIAGGNKMMYQVTGTIPETFAMASFRTPLDVVQMFTLNGEVVLVMVDEDTGRFVFGRLRGQAVEMLPEKAHLDSDKWGIYPHGDSVYIADCAARPNTYFGDTPGYVVDSRWRWSVRSAGEFMLGNLGVRRTLGIPREVPVGVQLGWRPSCVLMDPDRHSSQVTGSIPLVPRSPKIVTACAGTMGGGRNRFHPTIVATNTKPVTTGTAITKTDIPHYALPPTDWWPTIPEISARYWREGTAPNRTAPTVTADSNAPGRRSAKFPSPGVCHQVAVELSGFTQPISKVIWSSTPKRQRRSNKGRKLR